ncbi:hypothetical protein ACIRPR_01495 [Streptomyces griseoflavus]|uniref:hypothetical protein n=1 Tax=Streptomyces griseoflavus TaxID=35619 RepID=UPI0037FE1052
MADIYELQLALHLPDDLPSPDLDLLRRHLGQPEDGGEGRDGREDGDGGDRHDEAYEYPLLASRGPARKIDGALVGELHPDHRGWALSARQEVHPNEFDDLGRLVQWLGARTTTVGTIGHLRFHESDVPDLLIARNGSVHRATPRRDTLVESPTDVISDGRV